MVLRKLGQYSTTISINGTEQDSFEQNDDSTYDLSLNTDTILAGNPLSLSDVSSGVGGVNKTYTENLVDLSNTQIENINETVNYRIYAKITVTDRTFDDLVATDVCELRYDGTAIGSNGNGKFWNDGDSVTFLDTTTSDPSTIYSDWNIVHDLGDGGTDVDFTYEWKIGTWINGDYSVDNITKS